MNALATKEAIRPTQLVSITQEHLKKFDNLSTFQEVKGWDNLASQHAQQLSQTCNRLEEQVRSLMYQRNEAEATHLAQSLLKRLFKTSPVPEIQNQIDNLQTFLDNAVALLDVVQAKIDFSPNDTDSKKAMLIELRRRKKELQLEKREIGLEMQAIRSGARQQSVNAAYSVGSFFGGRKATAMQRQAIRYAKEQAIAPHEQEKARIDWEMTEIDRMILWVDRIF